LEQFHFPTFIRLRLRPLPPPPIRLILELIERLGAGQGYSKRCVANQIVGCDCGCDRRDFAELVFCSTSNIPCGTFSPSEGLVCGFHPATVSPGWFDPAPSVDVQGLD
jgi:hypothetical protein